MALTQSSVKTIHTDIRAALDVIAKKHNLSIANTHITYSDSGFKFRGEFGDKNTIGNTNPIFYNDLKKNGWRFGLKVEDIGVAFTMGANSFMIEGMKGNTFVIGKDSKGKMFKFRGEDVAAVLKRKNLLGDFGTDLGLK